MQEITTTAVQNARDLDLLDWVTMMLVWRMRANGESLTQNETVMAAIGRLREAGFPECWGFNMDPADIRRECDSIRASVRKAA